jgi:hypothetical protein
VPASAGNGGTTWTVDSQVARIGLDARGQAQEGYQIEFTTGKGNRGSIFIPKSQYNPTAAVQLIRQHATDLDLVSSSTQ